MEQDEKNFMDRYMATFSRLADAQAKGEDVNQVYEDIKKNMTGPMTDKELEFLQRSTDPGPSADFTSGNLIEIPESVDPSMFNEIPTTPNDMGSLPGPMTDQDMQFMQKTMPQTVSPMGSMINNVDDFLSNLGRKVGQNAE
jgi:hypothetical protein